MAFRLSTAICVLCIAAFAAIAVASPTDLASNATTDGIQLAAKGHRRSLLQAKCDRCNFCACDNNCDCKGERQC